MTRLLEGFQVIKYGHLGVSSKLRLYKYIPNEEKISWNSEKILNGINYFYIYDIINLEKVNTHEIEIKYKRNFYNDFGKIIRQNKWIFKNKKERDDVFDDIQKEYERCCSLTFLCMERRIRTKLLNQDSDSNLIM